MNATMFEALWFMLIGFVIGFTFDRLMWLTWIIRNKVKLKNQEKK